MRGRSPAARASATTGRSTSRVLATIVTSWRWAGSTGRGRKRRWSVACSSTSTGVSVRRRRCSANRGDATSTRSAASSSSSSIVSGWLMIHSTCRCPAVRRTGCRPRSTRWTSQDRPARSSAWSAVCTRTSCPRRRRLAASACARCQSPQRAATLADGAATVTANRSGGRGRGSAARRSTAPDRSMAAAQPGPVGSTANRRSRRARTGRWSTTTAPGTSTTRPPAPAAGRTAPPRRRRGRRPPPARPRPRTPPGPPAARRPSRRRRRRPSPSGRGAVPAPSASARGVPSPSRRSPTPAARTSPSCAVARRRGRRGCTTSGTAATTEPSIAAARRSSQPGSSGSLVPATTPTRSGADAAMARASACAGAAGLGDPRDLDPRREAARPSVARPTPTTTTAHARAGPRPPASGRPPPAAPVTGRRPIRRSAPALNASRSAADRRRRPADPARATIGRETPLDAQQGAHRRPVAQRGELLRPLEGDPPPVLDRRPLGVELRTAGHARLGVAGVGVGRHRRSMHQRAPPPAGPVAPAALLLSAFRTLGERRSRTMFPLWDVAIAPVLHAAHARRVVEIGALRGETTERMLDDLGPDAELHVIDPVPAFDPAEHERQVRRALPLPPGPQPRRAAHPRARRRRPHRRRPQLVHRLQRAAAARRGGPAPRHRPAGAHPPRRAVALRPARPLLRAGADPRGVPPALAPGRACTRGRSASTRPGLNPTMCNAEEEGGPRNGVMTGARRLHRRARPAGPQARAARSTSAWRSSWRRTGSRAQPELDQALDRLESSEGRYELLELAEDAAPAGDDLPAQRLLPAQRPVGPGRRPLPRARQGRAAQRALPRERAPARPAHAPRAASQRPHPIELRDPVRNAQEAYRTLERQRFAAAGPDDAAAASFLPYTPMGKAQLDHLEAALDELRSEGVAGDLVECGTGRGGGAIFMRAYLDAHELGGTRVWVVDRFRASPEPERAPVAPRPGRRRLPGRPQHRPRRLRPLRPPRRPGPLPPGPAGRRSTTTGPTGSPCCGSGGPRPTRRARSSTRSTTGWPTAASSSSTAGSTPIAGRRSSGSAPTGSIETPLEPVDASAVAWRKAAGDARPRAPPRRLRRSRRRLRAARTPRLAPPLPADPVDLSVVVVFYNMRREAGRTLHSLCRAYQEGIDDISYEVIVVENGSDDDQKLGAAFVRDFGPEFRYLDLGADADAVAGRRPQPGHRAQPRAGPRAHDRRRPRAHPRRAALRPAGAGHLRARRSSPPSSGTSGRASRATPWTTATTRPTRTACSSGSTGPTNGYRLFEIGHFVGDRDWLDGVWESNCMFVTRAQLEQVGGFDERFSMAGRRLRQPRALRAARVVARRHRVHDPRRGLVPPGPRRHDHQPDRRRRAARRGCSATASTTRELRGRPFQGPGQADPLRRPHHHGRRPAHQAAPAVDAGVRGGRRGHRRPTRPAHARARRPALGVHRRRLAQPAVAVHHLARGARPHRADRPARLPGDRQPGAARLGHRDRHQRPGPGHVPGLDLRADRARPGALDP